MDPNDPYVRTWKATSFGAEGPSGTRLAATVSNGSGLRIDISRERSRFQRERWAADRTRLEDEPLLARLAGITQVFATTTGGGVANRLDHSHEVAQIASIVAAELGLCVNLADAIGLAHDCGHLPFGHAGEHQLRQQVTPVGAHAALGADLLRARGYSTEVTSGVRSHSWSGAALCESPEAEIVRWADRIAYVTRDYADAVRLGLVPPTVTDEYVHQVLGDSLELQRKTLIASIVSASARTGRISMESTEARALGEFRTHNCAAVYQHHLVRESNGRARRCMESAINELKADPDTRGAVVATLLAMTDLEVEHRFGSVLADSA